MESFESLALSGAKKICGRGTCRYAFKCGHANNKPQWPKLRDYEPCPLAKYEVEPEKDPKPWWEMHASELEVSDDELFALCAACPHAKLEEDGDELVVTRIGLETYCLDCPVKGTIDAMDERRAEAAAEY